MYVNQVINPPPHTHTHNRVCIFFNSASFRTVIENIYYKIYYKHNYPQNSN